MEIFDQIRFGMGKGFKQKFFIFPNFIATTNVAISNETSYI